MPDPDKYERDFSFEGFQSGNPTSSQPGIRIDDELDMISAAIGGVVDAVKAVRRSDGKLQNGIVTLDSLSSEMKAAIGAPSTDNPLDTITARLDALVTALADVRRSDGKLQNKLVTLESLADETRNSLGAPPTDNQLAFKAASGVNADITGLSVLQTLSASPPVPDWLNRTVPYGPFTVNLGGLPPECLPGGGTVATFAAIQGFADVKTSGQNNLSTFVTGVSGIARSRMSNPSPVGVFGAAMANTPDAETAQVFAFNSVVTSQRDLNPNSTTGVKRAELYGLEIDMEVHPADDGSQPLINARGTWTVGNSRVQPSGEFTAHLVGQAGILRSPQIKWKKAFRSQEGAADIALEVCMSAALGQSGSQPINFVSMHPDGNRRTTSLQADAIGGMFVRSDAYFVYSNMAGAAQHSWTNLGYFPGLDNALDIGSSSFKFRNLYIGNSPIVGSDARLKTLRGDGGFTDDELDAWGDVEPTVYRMKAAVAEKGEAEARLHAGYVAQQIVAAFQAHGLDAFAYGIVCEEGLLVEATTPGVGTFKQARYAAVTVEDENGVRQPTQRYHQETDGNGNPLYDEHEAPTEVPGMYFTGETQMSVRYDECQIWQAAWQRRENARLRAELSALKARRRPS